MANNTGTSGNVITDFSRYDTLPHHYKKQENNNQDQTKSFPKNLKNQPGDWHKPNPARASYVAAIA